MKKFNYKIILNYDGTNYFGFQKQINFVTIQSVLENVLFKMTKQKNIKILGASRTDKGVHSEGQVVNFQTSFFISVKHFKNQLNFLLPLDIAVKKMSLVSLDFHARFQAKSKIYYYVFAKKPLNPFNYRFQVYDPNINFNKIKESIGLIEGKHNFSLFTKQKNLSNYFRTIFQATIKEYKQKYLLIFHGDCFMRYMIRFLVGFLIEISKNKKSLYDLKQMLELQINKKATLLAPARGLILKKIFY